MIGALRRADGGCGPPPAGGRDEAPAGAVGNVTYDYLEKVLMFWMERAGHIEAAPAGAVGELRAEWR